jgi:hypothetical protein
MNRLRLSIDQSYRDKEITLIEKQLIDFYWKKLNDNYISNFDYKIILIPYIGTFKKMNSKLSPILKALRKKKEKLLKIKETQNLDLKLESLNVDKELESTDKLINQFEILVRNSNDTFISEKYKQKLDERRINSKKF